MKYFHNNSSEQAAELLESIAESSTEYAIIATDLHNKVILWNKGAELIYGYTSEEMTGMQTPLNLHVKDASDNDILFLSENTFRSNLIDYKMTAIRKDGTVLPVSVTVTPRINHLKKIIGFLIIVRDITKIKLQEQYRDMLLEIVQKGNASDSIDAMCDSVINTIDKFLDVCSAFVCIFENQRKKFFIKSQIGLCDDYCTHSCIYTEDERTISKNIEGCFLTYSQLTINSGKLSDHIVENYVDARGTPKSDYSIIHIPLIFDISLVGILHIVVSTSKKEFLLNETQILSLIANEITAGIQSKRLIEEIKQYADNLEKMVQVRTDQLREKDAQLIQSGKLATLGEMATGIAHEINQPLGGISLMAQGLILAKARNKLDDMMLSEKLNSIIEQVDRINKIIAHLRTFARQSGDTKSAVDIKKPVLDVFKLIGQQLVKRDITLELDFVDEIPPILADHNKLEQVFLNIIGNARDAIEEMAKFTRVLKLDSGYPQWIDTWQKLITIRAYHEAGYVIVEIIDSGIGIPKKIINKIFEPFFTTKEVGKGTGIGLSITYGIVKEFEGTIEVESEELKGSKFILKFPVYKK